MDFFILNQEFESFDAIKKTKKEYETATNNLLVMGDCHKLKGYGDFKDKMVYERFQFNCKAGKERPSQSKGWRESSTYKMGCPAMVQFSLVKDKLKVVKVDLFHQFHNSDKSTFDHYPENLRLKPEDEKEVTKLVALGANKHKIKADLLKNGTTVSLKHLHNIQNKINAAKFHPNKENELQVLLEQMEKVPNAIIRVFTDEDNQLIGIFFQDDRMANFFAHFPEIIFFDGTYKLNNHDMPLFTQLCVDGNGESEIVSLFVCASESLVSIGSMIDVFQEYNGAWRQTKVIIGDKDFADRSVYKEKFPEAELQICLWHVFKTFNKEITTTKRGITKKEREDALVILQKLVYSRSAEAYDELYTDLLALNLDEVTKYYNENWHGIRNEWTMFGRNQHSNYLNSTNNRSESMNQKFKMISNRHANLATFFENVFTTITVTTSEKNLRAIRITMKKKRVAIDEPCLLQYRTLLTPFIFKKVQYEYEKSSEVAFMSLSADAAVTYSNGERGHDVTSTSCSCLYFTAMQIPCRHLFHFLLSNQEEAFLPEVCAARWRLDYYYNAHPAINPTNQVQPPMPLSIVKARIPSEMEKFRKSATVTRDINNLLSNMSNSQYNLFLGKLTELRAEAQNPNAEEPSSSSSMRIGNRESAPNSSAASATAEEVGSIYEGAGRPNSTATSLVAVPKASAYSSDAGRPNCAATSSVAVSEGSAHSHQENETNSKLVKETETNYTGQQSKLELQKVILPPKVTSIGRPKGSGNTVIGLKRTNKSKNTNPPSKQNRTENVTGIVKSDDVNGKVKKFADLELHEQGYTIIGWLTNKSIDEIKKKKITIGDIIQDANIFNRLRNDGVDLQCVKKFVDSNCYKYLLNEVDRLEDERWGCSKCKKNLSGYQLMCNGCLDWFHIECLNMSKAKAETVNYFCSSCK